MKLSTLTLPGSRERLQVTRPFLAGKGRARILLRSRMSALRNDRAAQERAQQ